MYTADASVIVSAPPQTTWNFVSDYQNFDRFMSNVDQIKMLDSSTSEWHMAGPLGIPVSWKAVTTEFNAPQRLAWKSIEGSLETSGFISIVPDGNGSRVSVHVEYNPPLGAIGEAVATAFKDPQAMLEHDLLQLENLISNGVNQKDSDKDTDLQTDEKLIGVPNLGVPGGTVAVTGVPGMVGGPGVVGVAIPGDEIERQREDLKEKTR
jgi:uncharacterized membrane protein